jgi:hypothetical protein
MTKLEIIQNKQKAEMNKEYFINQESWLGWLMKKSDQEVNKGRIYILQMSTKTVDEN